MNTTTQEVHAPARTWTFKRVAGVSILESVGAVGVIVLAIVGLAGIISNILAAVATLVIGAAILYEGGALGSGYRNLFWEAGGEWQQAMGAREEMTAEFMAGVAGIVLGILALFGVYPQVLLSAAIIVYGAAIMLSGTVISRLNFPLGFSATDPHQVRVQEMLREASANSGAKMFAGLASIVLGILSIIGLASTVLVLVALLALGVAGLSSGAAVGSRSMSLAHQG